MATVTPAVVALRAAGVSFTVHEYRHDPGNRAFGAEAASALGLDPAQVLKTLVVDADGRPAVAILPVHLRLSPKSVAAALDAKRVDLCAAADAPRITGYVVGAISPFGQRRMLRTVIDDSCDRHDVVYVSGG